MIISETVVKRNRIVSFYELNPQSKIPVTVKCDICGKEFISSKYQIIRNGHEMCQACAIRAKLEKRVPIGTKSGRLTVIDVGTKTGYSLCVCSCDKHTIREVWNQSIISGKSKSCGCLQSERASETAKNVLIKYARGSANWNWRGGTTKLRNKMESTAKYKNLRKQVFEISDYKCVKCGSPDNLRMHHICNFADYPDLRLSLDNCVCLCDSCHRKYHKIYGLKNTTRQQFTEFLSTRPA